MSICLRFAFVFMLLVGLMSAPRLSFAAEDALPKPETPQAIQEDNIRIAVFTYQFQQAYSGRPDNLQYYFLCGGFYRHHPYNPAKTVLDHFKNFTPAVYGITQASQYSNPAVGCKIDLVKMISPTVAHVNAEMFPVDGAQIDFATGYTYCLTLKGGTWSVTKHMLSWIQ